VDRVTVSQAPPAFALPAALVSQGYRLRPETEADIPFLMRLFASTRADELASTPWTPEQKAAFVAQQFEAQRYHYYNRLENCRFAVIEHGGEAIGRLYLQETPTKIHLVDIALTPERRGGGLGTAILEALLALAGTGGRRVDIFVEKFNPALNLYRRLGFREIKDAEVYWEMEWLPETVS